MMTVRYSSGMCAKGMPITSNTGAIQTCTSDANCGPNYQCVKPEFGTMSNVCCQTKSFVCGLNPDRGTACPNTVASPPQVSNDRVFNPSLFVISSF